jgi:hypothetical protein
MNFCRKAEGTGGLGKSSDSERNPRQTALDVQESATGVANNTPQETKTLGESNRVAVTVLGKPYPTDSGLRRDETAEPVQA